MKYCKKELKEYEKNRLLFRKRIPSSSTSNVWTVKFWKNLKITCNCPAGKYGNDCKHKDKALQELSPHQKDLIHEAESDKRVGRMG